MRQRVTMASRCHTVLEAVRNEQEQRPGEHGQRRRPKREQKESFDKLIRHMFS